MFTSEQVSRELTPFEKAVYESKQQPTQTTTTTNQTTNQVSKQLPPYQRVVYDNSSQIFNFGSPTPQREVSTRSVWGLETPESAYQRVKGSFSFSSGNRIPSSSEFKLASQYEKAKPYEKFLFGVGSFQRRIEEKAQTEVRKPSTWAIAGATAITFGVLPALGTAGAITTKVAPYVIGGKMGYDIYKSGKGNRLDTTADIIGSSVPYAVAGGVFSNVGKYTSFYTNKPFNEISLRSPKKSIAFNKIQNELYYVNKIGYQSGVRPVTAAEMTRGELKGSYVPERYNVFKKNEYIEPFKLKEKTIEYKPSKTYIGQLESKNLQVSDVVSRSQFNRRVTYKGLDKYAIEYKYQPKSKELTINKLFKEKIVSSTSTKIKGFNPLKSITILPNRIINQNFIKPNAENLVMDKNILGGTRRVYPTGTYDTGIQVKTLTMAKVSKPYTEVKRDIFYDFENRKISQIVNTKRFKSSIELGQPLVKRDIVNYDMYIGKRGVSKYYAKEEFKQIRTKSTSFIKPDIEIFYTNIQKKQPLKFDAKFSFKPKEMFKSTTTENKISESKDLGLQTELKSTTIQKIPEIKSSTKGLNTFSKLEKPNLELIGKTSSKSILGSVSKSKLNFRSVSKRDNKVYSKSKYEQTTDLTNVQRTNQKTPQESSQRIIPIVKQTTKQTSSQSYFYKLPTGDTPPVPPPPKVPNITFGFIPNIGFINNQLPNKYRITKKYGYNPTVAAAVLRIKGRQETKGVYSTGLSIRPIQR